MFQVGLLFLPALWSTLSVSTELLLSLINHYLIIYSKSRLLSFHLLILFYWYRLSCDINSTDPCRRLWLAMFVQSTYVRYSVKLCYIMVYIITCISRSTHQIKIHKSVRYIVGWILIGHQIAECVVLVCIKIFL